MAILGIDLGTTNSLAAVWRDGKSALIPNTLQEYLTPSAVSIDEDGAILVGQAAKERLVTHPASSAMGFKQALGTAKTFQLGDRPFAAEKLASFVLRRLKADAEAYLGEPVSEAVVSVPAYFSGCQRAAAKRACQLAGLKVRQMINEPSAVALACRLEDGKKARTYLIFDFGGSTLDVSLVECSGGLVEIAAISSDSHLGGDDFDRAIAERFCKENHLDPGTLPPIARAVLMQQAERSKIVLSSQEAAIMVLENENSVYSMSLGRNLLIEIAAPLFQRMLAPVKRVLRDSGINLSAVDDVILAGGSCKMPIVRESIGYLLGRSVRAISPDRIVALGLSAYAGLKEGKLNIHGLIMTDICPFTLGVAVNNRQNPEEPLMSPIIERNSLLPCSKSDIYSTVSDNQKMLRIKVYQGDNLFCSQNRFLGDVAIDVPPAPKGRESVEVRFTYDISGILELEATSKTTGKTAKTVLVSEETGLSAEEVEQRLDELSALKVHPRDEEENRVLLTRGKRLFKETVGHIRRMVMNNIAWFYEVLETQDPRKIRHARDSITNFFDALESGVWPYRR